MKPDEITDLPIQEVDLHDEIDNFDLREAVIYATILEPKHNM
jgi:hypothetical protein